jgi:DNA-binding Xre family transcriptional regulator
MIDHNSWNNLDTLSKFKSIEKFLKIKNIGDITHYYNHILEKFVVFIDLNNLNDLCKSLNISAKDINIINYERRNNVKDDKRKFNKTIKRTKEHR